MQQVGGETARLQRENEWLRTAMMRRDPVEADRVIQREIGRVRQLVAGMERLLDQQGREAAAGNAVTNHDPEQGMVRIEHFRNVGRATPAAAFQTAIWAAARGDFDELAQAFALSAAGRATAQAYIDRQPPQTRARFSTPEKLVAVPFAYDFAGEEGWQIVDTTREGDTRATLRLRRLKNGSVQGSERELPLERGPAGWRLVIPEGWIDQISDYITSASLRIEGPRKK